jgi:hypothetical protein
VFPVAGLVAVEQHLRVVALGVSEPRPGAHPPVDRNRPLEVVDLVVIESADAAKDAISLAQLRERGARRQLAEVAGRYGSVSLDSR